MANPSISNAASDQRKQEYILKYGSLPAGVTLKSAAKAPAAPVARPTSGVKPSTRVTPQNSTATPSKAPAPTVKAPTTAASAVAAATPAVTTDPLQTAKANASTYMSIIGGMPPETRNRYLSSYTDFLALPADQQSAYLSGLDQQAKDIVKPKIEQDRSRLKQDYDYEKHKREQEKNDLETTFGKIVADMDFTKNRNIAKDNTTAAKVMQNLGNVAFVTGVAGSGIFSRRTAMARENLQNQVEDEQIDFNQKKGVLELSKNQKQRTIDDEIAHLYDLNERDLSDLDQKEKEDELSLFFELAGNKFGQKGTQDAALLEKGVGSAAEDFAKGGDDKTRTDKYNTEQEKKRIASYLSQNAAARSRETEAINRYSTLYEISLALGTVGRSAEIPGIQAEMNRLRPTVEKVRNEARQGYLTDPEEMQYQQYGLKPRDFLGQGGSGIGSVDDWQNAMSEGFFKNAGLLYRGMNDESRKYISNFLQKNQPTIQMYNSNSPS